MGPYGHDASIQRGLQGTPDAVVCPDDAQAVADVLRWCYAHGVAVVPRGGGTGLAGGAVPAGGGVVVSVERLNGVRGVLPELGRMHVEAAVTTAHVSRLARENGLMFAPDPGAAASSQIGGNVATNAGGPHAFKYGATGAWVSGLEVALAPGELAWVGSNAPKDVSGYDLIGLLVGSEGTLGIVTAVHLRLHPAPASVLPAVVFVADLDAGQRLLAEILAGPMRPAVLDFVDARGFALAAGGFPGGLPGSDWFAHGRTAPPTFDAPMFLVELDGSHGAVAEQRSELAELLDSYGAQLHVQSDPAAFWRWRDGLNGVIAGVRGGKVSEDICVPTERLADAIRGVYAIGAELSLDACTFGHAGDGIVHATFLVDPSDPDELQRGLQAGRRALKLALELGGSITGEHGVGIVKRDFLGANWDAATLHAHMQIKAALDPKGLLNPGKKDPRGGAGLLRG